MSAEQRIKEQDMYTRRKFAIKMKESGFPPKIVTVDKNKVRGYSGIRLVEGKMKIKHLVEGR